MRHILSHRRRGGRYDLVSKNGWIEREFIFGKNFKEIILGLFPTEQVFVVASISQILEFQINPFFIRNPDSFFIFLFPFSFFPISTPNQFLYAF